MESLNLCRVSFLVVDPNPHIRRIIGSILKAFQCRDVVEAGTANEAIDLLWRRRDIDAMLTCWNMEEMNGIDLIRYMRRSDNSPDPFLPIIMTTGFSTKERVNAARDSGIDEFLAKPVSPKSLYSRIVAIVLKRRNFIKTAHYFGPDRHRRYEKSLPHPDRRKENRESVFVDTPRTGIAA